LNLQDLQPVSRSTVRPSGEFRSDSPSCLRFFRSRFRAGRAKAFRDAADEPAVADGGQSVHTPTMTLKNAAFLALVGTAILTILLVSDLIFDVLNVMRGLIPATTMLSSLIHAFAALTVTVFFYVFHKTQS
jgi:hypothetical protein